MIVVVMGQAGSGKDTVADHLVRAHGFAKVSFADPMKRFCREVFDFSESQVWGPLHEKNAPDARWDGLSPRVALQTLGTEWGRGCHPEVWIRYGLRVASELLAGERWYTPSAGLVEEEGRRAAGVVIADCRFANEAAAVKRAGGQAWRVIRPGCDGAVGVSGHASEAEQKTLPDSIFDAVLVNDDTLASLYGKADDALASAAGARLRGAIQGG
jgi:hypothetical protein